MTVDAPAAIVYETMANFFNPMSATAQAHQRAAFLFRHATQKGDMYGSDDVQAVLRAVQAWAESSGGVLQIILKPNDCFLRLPAELLRLSNRINA
ncbi:hypothetical protein PG994_005022 [Apiospora phragmitis]|uniref:Uncharacterized protein n=1 Tax=Apiospora phragmitis TaxID=2905665 RepID=A0ABR1VSB2_9PEZI